MGTAVSFCSVAGFTGKTCEDYRRFINGGDPVDEPMTNSTCVEDCDDDCKWEAPFWILLAALLSLLTLLGLAALYRFCCQDRFGSCVGDEEEGDIDDYITDEYDDEEYDDYDADSSYAYSGAGGEGGGGGASGGAGATRVVRSGRASRRNRVRTKRIRVVPSPTPASTDVVVHKTETRQEERPSSSGVTSDDVFETETDDETTDDDGTRWARRGQRNKASLSRFKYTIVD
jgi:hypothetical protein